MYEIARYTDVNNLGTATLLEALSQNPIEKLIVASSMSIYGEGLYRDRHGGIVDGARSLVQLRRGDWEVRGPDDQPLSPIATPESKVPVLASVYALSKYDQERMCLVVGRAYGIPTVALRLFNVYGPRQALSNPYTGVLAIFAARLLNGRSPLINEDGCQRRDFVSVHDVVAALSLAMSTPQADGMAMNIGSSQSCAIREIADRIAAALGKEHLHPEVTGLFRAGDIRHCFADISLARQVLGYQPQVSLEDGLTELGAWLEGRAAVDRTEAARAELAARGLAI